MDLQTEQLKTEDEAAATDPATHLGPQDKKNLAVKGYVVLICKDIGEFFPQGVCRWARRALRDGENVVNWNQFDDWKRHDAEFCARLEDGRITIGPDFHPLTEVVKHNEGRATPPRDARIAELEERIADLMVVVGNLAARLEPDSPKGGKK